MAPAACLGCATPQLPVETPRLKCRRLIRRCALHTAATRLICLHAHVGTLMLYRREICLATQLSEHLCLGRRVADMILAAVQWHGAELRQHCQATKAPFANEHSWAIIIALGHGLKHASQSRKYIL